MQNPKKRLPIPLRILLTLVLALAAGAVALFAVRSNYLDIFMLLFPWRGPLAALTWLAFAALIVPIPLMWKPRDLANASAGKKAAFVIGLSLFLMLVIFGAFIGIAIYMAQNMV